MAENCPKVYFKTSSNVKLTHLKPIGLLSKMSSGVTLANVEAQAGTLVIQYLYTFNTTSIPSTST